MRTVWKFLLMPGPTRLEIPASAKVVLVGVDPQNDWAIWVELDPDAPKVTRTFWVYGTGHEIDPSTTEHVGSFISGPFVLHVYERDR